MYQLPLAAAVLLTVFSGAPALAADADPQELQFFTREQYRACLDSEDRLKALRQVNEARVAENNQIMFRLQTGAKALFEEQKNVSPFDESQIDAFNKRLEEHNSAIAAANEDAVKLRAEHEAYHAESLEHNQRCGTLAVKLADREAVLKERKAAGKP
jgi:hypothetical protein